MLAMLISAVLAGSSAPAAADPSDVVAAAITAQRLPLERNANGGYEGAGWQRLINDAASAQFTMVGEQHGSGSLALFETALHKALAARGYTHSALEIGPATTRYVEQLVRSGRGKLQRYIAAPGHGFAVPFLFFREEADLAEQMVALSPDPIAALWGLDQEFVGGGPVHADLLEGYAHTPGEKAAAAAFRDASNKNAMYSGTVTEEQLAPLRSAFAGNRDALALIEALAASSTIYKPFVTHVPKDIYASNLARETMMKHNFVTAFTDAERRQKRVPKVFLKFGANHAMRGHSDTDVPSLANFIAEWGTAQNMRLVNVFVECDGGQSLNPQTNKAEKCEPYFDENSKLRQVVRSGPALQLYDLRPLRAKLGGWKQLDGATRKVILAFDFYVTIRDAQAATPAGSPPALPH